MRDWIEKHYEGLIVAPLASAALLCAISIRESFRTHVMFALGMAIVTLVLVVVAWVAMLVVPEQLRTSATERTLRLVSSALSHVEGGLTPDNCQAICELLLPETHAMAVAMTDTKRVTGYVGEDAVVFPVGSEIHTLATHQVLDTGEPGTFEAIVPTNLPLAQRKLGLAVIPAGIIVPIKIRDEVVGTIKFYYRRRGEIDRSQMAIALGLGELLSTQFSADELDRQAELTARAEVKALQAQINPHFLFNTLNTIAALTRTDPMQARDLLREFAVFYRQTLENSESRIPLFRELEQTRRYLRFEYARFGEDRIIAHSHVEPGCEGVPVPAFLIQPIVENAVRHAMRDEGPLRIDAYVATEGDDVLIAVTDDGLGMDEETAKRLLEGPSGFDRTSDKGTGIALRNVAERVERFYGVGSGVEIMSKPGEGTSVTIRLANAAPKEGK